MAERAPGEDFEYDDPEGVNRPPIRAHVCLGEEDIRAFSALAEIDILGVEIHIVEMPPEFKEQFGIDPKESVSVMFVNGRIIDARMAMGDIELKPGDIAVIHRRGGLGESTEEDDLEDAGPIVRMPMMAEDIAKMALQGVSAHQMLLNGAVFRLTDAEEAYKKSHGIDAGQFVPSITLPDGFEVVLGGLPAMLSTLSEGDRVQFYFEDTTMFGDCPSFAQA